MVKKESQIIKTILKYHYFLWMTLVVLNTGCSLKNSEKQPNFIIIFTDDQGYADIGVYGAQDFKTPHLDKMAEEGLKFTNFYVPASVCTPSRAGLLTGSYPKRIGLHKNVLFPFSTTGLNPNEIIIPEILKPLGYITACIGKWHLGHQQKFMPNNQGFDYFYGVPYSNDMDGYAYTNPSFKSPPLPIYKNTKKVAEGTAQDSLTIKWTNAAVSFIKENKNKPFFMYLAHNMPHVPWHVSKKFKGSSKKGLYGDVIQELDWSVGEILKTLKETGLDDNTMVIYTSDNGPSIHKKNGGSALPLRGGKASTWEGGLRVPCIIRWPKKIPANKEVSQLITAMDFLPTIATIAKADKTLLKNKIDGYDISNLLFSKDLKTLSSPYDAFYYYGRNGDLEAVRRGDWKFHKMKYNPTEKYYDTIKALYNLKNDIGEQHNLIGKHPKIAHELLVKMYLFDKEITEQSRPIGQL
ncbi:sulfatase [Flavicella sp.]|uniref:sulfatase family protein n=1 Tax=Flavicella sp. TaxID=2957742 RepID=UPI003018F1F1